MTELVVRRLLIDLETPLPRHWCDGDPFRTALFNALSMSFPVGEQFFIDAVRDGLKQLPPDQQARYQAEVQGFIGQEATHRRIHGLFNGHLEAQGLVNGWAPRILKRMKLFDRFPDVRHRLAVTAAYEHFTAILAEWLLTNHDMLNGSEPRLKTMWLWHSAEETEHKTTAFDIYRALDGGESGRLRWFRHATMLMIVDLTRQTLNNLWRDGTFWRWATWKSAARHLFGERGVVRQIHGPWKQYFRADFHPSEQDGTLSRNWLRDNTDQYVPVGG